MPLSLGHHIPQIVYEDGDAEWMTYQHLQETLLPEAADDEAPAAEPKAKEASESAPKAKAPRGRGAAAKAQPEAGEAGPSTSKDAAAAAPKPTKAPAADKESREPAAASEKPPRSKAAAAAAADEAAAAPKRKRARSARGARGARGKGKGANGAEAAAAAGVEASGEEGAEPVAKSKWKPLHWHFEGMGACLACTGKIPLRTYGMTCAIQGLAMNHHRPDARWQLAGLVSTRRQQCSALTLGRQLPELLYVPQGVDPISILHHIPPIQALTCHACTCTLTVFPCIAFPHAAPNRGQGGRPKPPSAR